MKIRLTATDPYVNDEKILMLWQKYSDLPLEKGKGMFDKYFVLPDIVVEVTAASELVEILLDMERCVVTTDPDLVVDGESMRIELYNDYRE